MTKRRHTRRARAIKGYALIATLLIGSFSIMFLLALGGGLLSTSRISGVYKSKRLLQEAAEIGLDYAVRNMNDAITNDTSSIFDITAGTTETVQNLPASYYSSLISDATVKIKIRKLSDTELSEIKQFSTVYQSSYGPGSEQTNDYDNPGLAPTANLLRVAEITASNGTFSKSLRAVLEPQFPGASGGGGGGSPDRKGLFPSAGMFANRNLSIDGKVVAQIHPATAPLTAGWSPGRGLNSPGSETLAPNMNYRLDVQTNRFAEIKSGAQIVGNLKISNSTLNAPSVVGTAQDGAKIYGRAFLTNSPAPEQATALLGTAGNTPGALDSVLAQADRDTSIGGAYNANRAGYNNITPVSSVSNQSDLKQFILPPVPTDSSAIDPYSGVGSTSGSTRWEYVFPTMPGYQEQSSFKVNALQLTNGTPGATKLSFIPLTNAPPAKVYIEGGAVLDTDGLPLPALNIDSNMFTISEYSTNPLALQIFYGGTQEIRINLTNGANGNGRFDGVIFAPNAKVTITGKGNFNGSVVADDLQISAPINQATPLTLNLVPNLDAYSTSSFNTNALQAPSYQPASDSGAATIEGYSPITYQKLNTKLVE